MERSVYTQMAELDQRHWWYRARREVLAALILRAVGPAKDATILEIGCGTGHNLAMLGEFGKVDALGRDDQLELIQINSLSSAINQAAQLASNLLSSSNQTENAIIGNIGR